MSTFHAVQGRQGDRLMKRPDTPFPRHWLYYVAIEFIVLAGAVALVLRLYGAW